MVSANDRYAFALKDDGTWGVWDSVDSKWITLMINKGGTGASDAEGASKSLGFHIFNGANITSATAEMDSYIGLSNGSAGMNYQVAVTNSHSVSNWPTTISGTGKAYGWGMMRVDSFTSSGNTVQWYVPDDGANLFFRQRFGAAFKTWVGVWTNKNTTVDSSGFIKRSSPVIKIFADGSYETNEESEGCVVRRISEGVYSLEGCTGLNSDTAWGGMDGGFEIPVDRNKQPLIWLDYEVNADGSVLVKTYHRAHPEAPAFARNELQGINDGDPVDIPYDQFLSVRVEMPADSLYNQKMRAGENALATNEGE